MNNEKIIRVSKEELPAALTRLEVENFRYVLDLMEETREVVKKFDKKVLNVRLERALSEIDKYLSVSNQYGRFEIRYCVQNCNVCATENGNWSSAHYVQNREIPLTAYMSNDSRSAELHPTDENNRIIAENILAAMDKHEKYIKSHIESIESAMATVEANKARLKEIAKERDEIMRSIPYEVREHFRVV